METDRTMRNLAILGALLGLVVPVGVLAGPTAAFYATLFWGGAVLFVVGTWIEAKRRRAPATH